ncbi:MAG: TonB-dependent receptor [Gemmatimonadetes bacterium]|nr:TonB-dependent receptor [Gemmatimonadota bacterium]
MRFLRGFSGGAPILLLTAAAAWAQATAQLSGTVRDESGGVLPGVTVSATQTDTGFTRTVVTAETGSYVLTNLPTGPYRLEVSLSGFRTYIQTGIVLQVAAAPTINPVLEVGSLEETVAVEAAAPLVDVQSAGISDVVEQERIVELPLQGRQVTNLIVLAGAAVQAGTASPRSVSGGVAIAVAGGQGTSVAYSLDGAMHNDPHNNLNLPLPFPDALQEFRVATAGLSADNGMHAGASVNAVTKSGTNSFHGNLFEFLRDKRFNATSPFARILPDGSRQDDGLRRHQFGGTLGGPIATDKLFFFGGYQGTHLQQTPTDNIAYVPTAAMLAGDFTAFASPACNSGRPVTLRAPFVNNRVDPALFSRAAVNLAGRLPTTTDPCGEIRYGIPSDGNDGQGVARLDYQWSASRTLFGRYMATFEKRPAPISQTDNILSTTTAGRDTLAQSLAVGDTTVLGANAVNSLRFVFNRTAVDRSNPPFVDPRALGSNVFSYDPGHTVITVTGGFNISGGTAATGIFKTNSYQVADDFTLVRGRHQIAFGGNVAYWRSSQLTHARSGGDWSFGGQATGLGMADFLLGRVTTLQHGAPIDVNMSQLYLGFYGQDAWRTTDRMTLNVGLRWEPYFGQKMLNDAISNFSLERFRQGVKSTVFVNAPAGFIYPGDAGFPGGRTGLNAQWRNFSPRVGLGWDLTGDGTTALRASYSLGYSFPIAEYQIHHVGSPPFATLIRIDNPPGGFDNPYAHIGGDPHPFRASRDVLFPPSGSYGVMSPDINSPRIQNWNVTIEQQIGSDWGVSLSYLGAYSDRLWNKIALNPGEFLGLDPCTLNGVFHATCTNNANLNERRRLTLQNPAEGRLIATLDEFVDIGSQAYRGLKISVRRRAASGVSINGNYTWSHCFGDATTVGFVQPAGGYTDPDNPDADRGNCTANLTHIANVSIGAETPRFAAPALRAVASAWRASAILSARSGDWLTVSSGRVGYNGQRFQDRRADQVSDNVYADRTLNNYLNRAAFAQPAADAAIGNHRFNSISGPAFWTIDLALSKLVSFGVGQAVEFRVEAFNLLNRFNWGNPQTNLNAGTFGRITSQTGESRVMQFGIKYGF